MGIRWLLALLPFSAPGIEAVAAAASLEDDLPSNYYEIEFFVFERPAVLEFNTEEALALDAPRALPYKMRTQRLDPESIWTDPLGPATRARLTFPTLTYELLPPTDAPVDTPLTAPDTDPRTAAQVTAGDAETRPAPAISPRLEPDPVLDLLARVGEFERSLESRADRWLPPEALTLNREAARVRRSGIGRVLFHGRWLQAVPPREAPDPILVRGGEVLYLPERTHELVGTVNVTLGRYLHFQADLYLHGPGFGLAPAVAVADASGEPEVVAPPLPAARYMRLAESRRMRSEEVHYLDHPKLGLIVRIDPVALPAELVEAFEALEENAE